MKLTIDEDLGTAYLAIKSEGTPVVMTLTDVVAHLDFDENEDLIGIELLGFKKSVQNLETNHANT